MGFLIVEKSVLTICKKPIPQALGAADHFYLASTPTGSDTLGWGPLGIEITGVVQVTAKELERVERFIKTSKYSISVHNCEHFANYVLHGINHSRQMYNSFKQMGAIVVEMLQPVNSASSNYSDALAKQAAYHLNEQLRKVKIDRANAERVEFWSLRGVDCS
jgi:hypothetical protein